jgi:hypothetical protein
MNTTVIPLHELQRDAEKHLRQCCDTGQRLVVELPDHRLLSIQPLDEDDDLVNQLIEKNPAFRAMLARSAASPRKPFQPADFTTD